MTDVFSEASVLKSGSLPAIVCKNLIPSVSAFKLGRSQSAIECIIRLYSGVISWVGDYGFQIKKRG